MSWESQGIALLAASLVRPFGLAAAAWLVLRVFGIRHPASRHAVWTAVLIGMILLPFVSVMTPHWKLPVLPAKHDPAIRVVASGPGSFTASDPIDLDLSPTAHASKFTHLFEWPSVEILVIWLYLAGLFAMVVYRAAGCALLWRVMANSRRLRARALRESDDVLTPVATGLLRAVVILPAGWRGWSADTRRRVLAHEFAHLRRHDALVSALAWWAKCVFWFHPLAWWVARQVSELAELACDAAVLEKFDDPCGYSRMLLGFADAVNRAGRRVALPGLAIASGSGMDRRIDGVFEISGGKMRKLARPGVWLALTGLPAICLAATMGLGEPQGRSPVVAEPVTPRFEVASIKPTAPQANGQHGITMHGGPGTSDPTRMAWTNVSVTLILKVAANAYLYQIIRPAWLDSQLYDISANIPPGATKEQFHQMLLNLLAERFNLVLHRESREYQGFELVAGKNGAKLRESAPVLSGDADAVPADTAGPPKTDAKGFPQMDRPGVAVTMKMEPGARVPSVFLAAREQALGELVHMLGEQLGRPVVDKTGLTGKYDYTLEFPAQESLDAADDSGPGIRTAVQEQLGLKLEPKKVPLEMLIVDHADKAPSGN